MSRTSLSSKTLLALVLMALATSAALASNLALVRGDKAPGMRGQSPEGQRVVVLYKPETVTLINFWATWCVPCRQEMPALQELYSKRSQDGLQVVGVHAGFVDHEDLEAFLDQVEVDYTIVLPDQRWLDDWGGISVMPLTFLVDGEGKVLRRYLGATEEQIAGLIHDAEAALDGRELGPVIVPETPNVATEEDKP
jgi:thiol-disulfide isomerase/thioredoxin